MLHTILHRTDLIVFPLTLQTNHHISDDVYLREGGVKKERNYRAKIYMVSLLHRATIISIELSI